MTMTKKKTKRAAAPKPAKDRHLRTLSVPVVPTEKYAQLGVNMDLTPKQATTLRAVLEGLEIRHAKTSDGKLVRSTQDALRWVIEQIGAAC